MTKCPTQIRTYLRMYVCIQGPSVLLRYVHTYVCMYVYRDQVSYSGMYIPTYVCMYAGTKCPTQVRTYLCMYTEVTYPKDIEYHQMDEYLELSHGVL